MSETALFLSPHLDDVVLSCPGRVLTEVSRGRRAIIATLFTENDSNPDTHDLYERRRKEDARAAATLGAEHRWLGLPDAPFRRSFYASFRTIVLETHPEDERYVAVVAAALRALLETVEPHSLHLPLGVGTHIDHRLTHAAVARLIESGRLDPGRVVYYEDRPYAFVRHQVRMRLAELGLRPAAPPPSDLAPLASNALADEFLISLDATRYVSSYLPPGAERDACRRRLVDQLLREPPRRRVVRPLVLTLDAPELERCIRAVAAYESQIGELFGSMEGVVEAARRYTRWLGASAAYAERAWTGE